MTEKLEYLKLIEAGVSLIDCVHKTPSEAFDDYRYIAIPQMKNGRVNDREARRISYNDYLEWTKKAKPQINDVILSRRCNPGETAFVPDGVKWALGQNLVLLRADGAKVYPPYLRWLLRSTQWWEQVNKYINVGAIFDSLKCADVPNFILPIPDINYQKKAAHVLNLFDDKIELNKKMNETLTDLAVNIFKDLFIDFSTVKSKAESEQPFGLNDEIISLLPDSFEESSIGMVPSGWRVKDLDEIANFLNGLALQKYPPTGEGDLPVIKIAQLRINSTKGSDLAASDLPAEYIVNDGDILFSWSGTLEVRIWSGGQGALNQHLFKVTSDSYPKWFYYLWCNYHLKFFRGIAESKATTMGHIQRKHLSDAKVVVPPDEVMDKLNKIFAPMISKIIENELEARILERIRNIFLPKIVLGELNLN
ncbi:MAG: hypothetical protein A2X86_17705 [Bdellovibrionales bacterium GWA2_49_15]|nr:MAG: hypothetical protein A2X86_17705 [Bdellovibrionales bacterium GWA2_49_15]